MYALNLSKNADISIFVKKEGKDIYNKIIATLLLASLTAFFWFSLFSLN